VYISYESMYFNVLLIDIPYSISYSVSLILPHKQNMSFCRNSYYSTTRCNRNIGSNNKTGMIVIIKRLIKDVFMDSTCILDYDDTISGYCRIPGRVTRIRVLRE
jgi:hypothetical protein